MCRTSDPLLPKLSIGSGASLQLCERWSGHQKVRVPLRDTVEVYPPNISIVPFLDYFSDREPLKDF